MKKLFFFATAAVVLASCNNDVTISENTALAGSNAQKEIGFYPLAQGPKRAAADVAGAIEGTVFPTSLEMTVGAYDVTNNREFFATPVEFAYNYAGGAPASSGYWGGKTAQYWPLAATQINFLAIANANVDPTFNAISTNDKTVTIAQTDNYAYTAQRDLMYARGTGEVTKAVNALTFPDKVDMVFKHAQSYLVFRLRAADDATAAAITIKDILVKDAYYAGTATVTHTNWNAFSSQDVTVAWAGHTKHGESPYNYSVNINNQTAWANEAQALTTNFVELGHSIVLPHATAGLSSFTIQYWYDDKDYAYEYTPTSKVLEAGKKYIYDITFKLHEIFIEPVVVDWEDQGQFIDIPSYAVGENYNYGTISGKASTYQFAITGLKGAAPTIAASVGSAAFASAPTITAAGVATFSVAANFTNATKAFSLTVTDAGAGNTGKSSVITFNQDKFAVPYVANGVATVTIPATADTYYFDITGLAAGSYKMAEGEDGTDFITAVTPTSDTAVEAGASLAVSVTVTAESGKSRSIILKNGDTKLMTIIVKQQ